MKKLLTLITVLAVASGTAFAYVPLNNTQNNLGSFQNDATYGMFYNELDIISAYPVELLDSEGTNLYTNWSNARNYATSGSANTNAPWTNTNTGAVTQPLGTLLLGFGGNPLGMFDIEGSRAGVVFQNFGSKTANTNLDGAGANESAYVEENVTLTKTGVVVENAAIRQIADTSDLEDWDNRTVSQWNVGLAKKDVALDGMDMGLSLTRVSDKNIHILKGMKSYVQTYLTSEGATTAIMPPTATEGDSYSAAFIDNEIDENSEAMTDLLAQGKKKVMDNLTVKAGVGLRFHSKKNPGGLYDENGTAQGVLVNNAVTSIIKEDQNILVATVGTQYFDEATSISGGLIGLADAAGTVATYTGAAYGDFDENWAAPANAGTTEFSDDRSGLGQLIRLEGVYEMDNVDLVGVFNYDYTNLKIDASQTMRRYINEKASYLNAGAVVVTDFTEIDYTGTITSEGNEKTSNLDFGVKAMFKGLEKINLSLGAFIARTKTLNDFTSVKASLSTSQSYSDGLAADTPFTTGDAEPIAGDRFGATGGAGTDGEGTQVATVNREWEAKTDVTTINYAIPIGAELPLWKDKWLFRAGVRYAMQKQTTIDSTVRKFADMRAIQTPAGGTATEVYTYDSQYMYTSNTTYAETHTMDYNYGIQWMVSPNLTLCANAVLDTNPNLGADKATLLDLDTYRLMSVQAIIRF